MRRDDRITVGRIQESLIGERRDVKFNVFRIYGGAKKVANEDR